MRVRAIMRSMTPPPFPSYPLTIVWADGSEVEEVEDLRALMGDIEQFDTERPEDYGVVTDAYGRRVRLRVEPGKLHVLEREG